MTHGCVCSSIQYSEFCVDVLRFLQRARVFSLSEIMFNILSASTWIILKNKMLSEKGRLQKDKYNMPPLIYLLKYMKHWNAFLDAYTYIW